MNAQKIAEAAAVIKKAELAKSWFERNANAGATLRTLQIETIGDYTGISGHGEAKEFVKQAFERFKQTVFNEARVLADLAKEEAEAAIRAEVEQ